MATLTEERPVGGQLHPPTEPNQSARTRELDIALEERPVGEAEIQSARRTDEPKGLRLLEDAIDRDGRYLVDQTSSQEDTVDIAQLCTSWPASALPSDIRNALTQGTQPEMIAAKIVEEAPPGSLPVLTREVLAAVLHALRDATWDPLLRATTDWYERCRPDMAARPVWHRLCQVLTNLPPTPDGKETSISPQICERAWVLLVQWRQDVAARTGTELPRPAVFGTGTNTVLFDWEVGDKSLELEIGFEHQTLHYATTEMRDGADYEEEGEASLNEVTRLLDWLLSG